MQLKDTTQIGNKDNKKDFSTIKCEFQKKNLNIRHYIKIISDITTKMPERIILNIQKGDNENIFYLIHQEFKNQLLHNLDPVSFAESFVQTFLCILFFIRIIKWRNPSKKVTDLFPHHLPHLKTFFQNLFSLEHPNTNETLYQNLGIKELLVIFDKMNIPAIIENFQQQNLGIDLISYFYESFLKTYNPHQKAGRGIFHTPSSVASFIVRSVDFFLRKEFACSDGLADTSTITVKQESSDTNELNLIEIPKVQILDYATGTGTFLEYIIQKINTIFKKKHNGLNEEELTRSWNEYVSNHLLNRLFGFELLIPPYLMAHLKLNLLLEEYGFNFSSKERLRIYLTNALNPGQTTCKDLNLNGISSEEVFAGPIKASKQISIIIGNPPYSRSSKNTNKYIENLMNTYKRDVRNEKNIQPLSDDYLKFIRLAQEYIQQRDCGIIGLVTNHSFLTGLIHKGVRTELMKIFNRIYVLDLHGSKIVQERVPKYLKDENLFDVRQGICIIFLLKIPSSNDSKVFHFDLFGSKATKFEWLNNNEISTIVWSELPDLSPGAPFMKSSNLIIDSPYHTYPSLPEIFDFYNVGGKPGDDKLLVAFEPEQVIANLKAFIKKSTANVNGGTKTEAKRKLLSVLNQFSFNNSKLEKYNYRPFDIRWTYYDPSIWTRPVQKLKAECQNTPLLLCSRIVKDNQFSHVFVSNLFTDVIFLSNTSSVNCYVFPLLKINEKGIKDWNLTSTYLTYLQNMGIDIKNIDSLKPLAYIYSILHSNHYITHYSDFLKRNFPRIPFFKDPKLFSRLVELGEELVNLHLDLKVSKQNNEITMNISPNDKIQNGYPKYNEQYVYIAPNKYFYGITQEIWDYKIGKYQICYKWLRDRKTKNLTETDIQQYLTIANILKETIRLIKEIDNEIIKYDALFG
ncbi:MAG TPA: type ISP restriction/modification enzyme [Candidatus Deferrimicrobium sp.]|nr:type ISP restriction/modification enzyme [Candidatus Deferrimicrobium sp.]